MDSTKTRTGRGEAVPSNRITPLKLNPSLSGPPVDRWEIEGFLWRSQASRNQFFDSPLISYLTQLAAGPPFFPPFDLQEFDTKKLGAKTQAPFGAPPPPPPPFSPALERVKKQSPPRAQHKPAIANISFT